MRQCKRRACCWTFAETDQNSPWRRKYRFDFTYIRSVRLRRELQDYMWHHCRSGVKSLATLRQENSWLKYYEAWLYERGIDSLFQIRREDAEGFLTFLHTCVSKKTGRPLRLITQKHIYDTVRSVYRWYAVGHPEYAAVAQLFPADVYQRINRIVRTDYVSQGEVAQFLQVVEKTKNPCLCFGGTILTVTGLAPADLLSLRTDCIQMGRGGTYLRYYHHRKRTYCTVPVSEVCVRAVQKLKEQTDELRRIAPKEGKQQLFLYCNKWEQVVTPEPDLFRYWMRRAQEKDLIQEAHGKSAVAAGEVLTATMLRRALIRDMWERNVPYMVIRELTGSAPVTERGSIA